MCRLSKNSYVATFFAMLLSLVVVASCAEDKSGEGKKGDDESAVASVTLGSPTSEFFRGEAFKLTATITPATAQSENIEWTSGNEAVATVSDKGVVTMVGKGKATIKATVGDKTATVEVSVLPDIYVGGKASNVATVWLNGKVKCKPADSSVKSYVLDFAVVGEDIYAGGYSDADIGEDAKIWKNSEIFMDDIDKGKIVGVVADGDAAKLFKIYYTWAGVYDSADKQYTSVFDGRKNGRLSGGCMFKSGGDVYLGVNEVYYNGDKELTQGRVLKNGEVLYTLVPSNGELEDCNVAAVAVEGENVYVAGKIGSKAVVWRNGKVLYTLSDGVKSGEANSLCVVDGVVYVCGGESDKETYLGEAMVWRNGEVLYRLTDGTSNASANSVVLYEGDVYVAGSDSAAAQYAMLWKNGKLLRKESTMWSTYAKMIIK